MAVQREEVRSWFAEQIPAAWFEDLDVLVDRDEILVIGRLPQPTSSTPDAAIAAFREDTREDRIRIARRAERRWARKVSWGARCGDVRRLFTTVSVPAMTRLRFGERAVLDTLIDAGVARSRSDALAWCVRLVGANQERWLADLREAFERVERIRAEGPRAPAADEEPRSSR